jgi:HK97 family phage major capsid protein
MKIKFLKDCTAAGRKLGDLWEIQDLAIARAYIQAGYCEEVAESPTADAELMAFCSAEIQRGLAAVTTGLDAKFKELARTFSTGLADVGRAAGSRFNPGYGDDLQNGESADEKLIRRGGFKNLAHFAYTINRAGSPAPGNVADDSLLGKYNTTLAKVNIARAVSSPDGMYETSEPDGGALVPPDFTTQIWERIYSQEKILPRTQGYTVSGNTMKIPANTETSRVDGSRWGGVLGYWEGEAQQLTGSRPKFRSIDMRLKKLTVFTFVTNELLTDSATALEQYLGRVAPDEIDFKILDALINGTGAGIPLGILNDPAFITVAKDTGQAAKTISYTNVMNMYNRMWAPSRARSIWVYNQEVEPQLWQMALPVGTGGVPVYLPPGMGGGVVTGGGSSRPYGAAGTNTSEGSPFAWLYGRPAIALEQCPGLGSPGDIMLIDWSQYLSISKGTVQTAMSMHLKFDYDESVFRWIFRMDGQGAWSAPLTPFKTNTSATYSFAVGLAQR